MGKNVKKQGKKRKVLKKKGNRKDISRSKFSLSLNRKHKDTVFTKLFNDANNLLELYNGINGSHYTNADELRINTLDNSVILGMKNDVSYVFEFEMHIYEHQSTRNPNMPLRNLFYVSRLLEIELELNGDKESIYGEDKVMIPTPRFIVFYNGKKEEPEKYEYRLSDLYKNGTKDPDLELRVTVLNINMGMNEKLMEQCKTLRE